MAAGRISTQIDSPLDGATARLRDVPAEAADRAAGDAYNAAQSIWKQETAGRASTRVQTRVLADTARVDKSRDSTILQAGGAGRLSTGTPVTLLATATENGMSPDTNITQRSQGGNRYSRRLGDAFGRRTQRGNVVQPAAEATVDRLVPVIGRAYEETLSDALGGD